MMLPKSEITQPRQGERLPLGSRLVEGLAWAGPEAVAAVELSCDGGESWKRAELVGPPRRYTMDPLAGGVGAAGTGSLPVARASHLFLRGDPA